jgi:hypothetical protein
MFLVRFYERTKNDEGEDRWTKIGEVQHPANDAQTVADNAGKLLGKTKDAARVGRIVIERQPDAGQAEFSLAAPKKKKDAKDAKK